MGTCPMCRGCGRVWAPVIRLKIITDPHHFTTKECDLCEKMHELSTDATYLGYWNIRNSGCYRSNIARYFFYEESTKNLVWHEFDRWERLNLENAVTSIKQAIGERTADGTKWSVPKAQTVGDI